MENEEFCIPIVDFNPYAINIKRENVQQSSLDNLATEMCSAFRNIGFVYLKNHGISEQQVQFFVF